MAEVSLVSVVVLGKFNLGTSFTSKVVKPESDFHPSGSQNTTINIFYKHLLMVEIITLWFLEHISPATINF